jgi:hypothetical protein
LGELTYDTDLGTIRVHNNAVAGGVSILATQAQVNLINANLVSAVGTISNSISTISGIDATFAANINALLANAVSQQSTINTTSANLALFQTYANTTFGTSNYGNANVASYLPTSNIVASINANVTAANTTISTLQANIGSYYYWANANVAGLSTSIGNLQSNAGTQADAITSLRANITAANLTIAAATGT